MPSLTLLAADPHLTPVRARPALAFGGRAASRRQLGSGRLSLRLPSRRRPDGRSSAPGASAPAAGPADSGAATESGTKRARWRVFRGRGTSSPGSRRSWFGWRTAAAAALVALTGTGLGVLRVWPPLAVVMSGSMAPTINTGDMVVLMRLRSPAKVGQVVAVPVPDDARTRYGYPPVVIHRIYRITDGQIRTKGDARPAADPFTVRQTAVEATVIADIPAGGRILSFFHSGPGLVWLLSGAALFFGLPLLERLRDARGREAEATADLRDQLAAVSLALAELQTEQERSRQIADEVLSRIAQLTGLVAVALDHHAPAGPEGPAAYQESLAEVAATDSSSNGASAIDSAQPTDAAPARAPAGVDEAETDGEPEDRTTTESVGRSPAGSAQPYRTAEAATFPRSSGDLLALVTPSAAPPSRPALGRWDAPPAPTRVVDAGGWTAPPVPVRSVRFQRPGRLIRASLAQPSPTA
jgi:signal peptidase I